MHSLGDVSAVRIDATVKSIERFRAVLFAIGDSGCQRPLSSPVRSLAIASCDGTMTGW
jgi:hypothetical protein